MSAEKRVKSEMVSCTGGRQSDEGRRASIRPQKPCAVFKASCKKEILAKIALHYPEAEREAVWEQVQLRYAELLSDWRTDLGGKKNFHNGVGGTYDCIAIMSYYVVCKAVTSF